MATCPITYWTGESKAGKALLNKYGEHLEKLTAKDKLDMLWVIITSIAASEKQGKMVTLGETQEEQGVIFDEAPNSEEALSLIDSANPGVPDLLAIAHVLAMHLHEGDYASE
jgi:hypothetical protein